MDVNNKQEIIVHGKLFEPYISDVQINAQINELGVWLQTKFDETVPVFISILNGSVFFAADLIRAFKNECEITFIKLESYQGVSSSGTVSEVIGLNRSIEGRDVVVIEDIIDSGLTIQKLLEILSLENPKSVTIITLLDKPSGRKVDVEIHRFGFKIEDKFVIGYGLDYDQLGRNLPSIYKEKIRN